MALSTADIVEIQQVQALYGHAVDWPDQSLLSGVFSEDAIFDALDGRYTGLSAISDWFGEGKPPHPQSHNMMNIWVYEKDDAVRVKAKWVVRSPANGEIYFGDYDDVMTQTDAGWRIRHRVVSVRDPAEGAQFR